MRAGETSIMQLIENLPEEVDAAGNWQALSQEELSQIDKLKITQCVIDTIKLYADTIDYSDIFAEEDNDG
jgi:hypothetical protein